MQRLIVVVSAFFLFDINIWSRRSFFFLPVFAVSNYNVKVDLPMEKNVLAMVNKAFQSHKNGELSEAIDSYENVLPFLSGKTKANLHGNKILLVSVLIEILSIIIR